MAGTRWASEGVKNSLIFRAYQLLEKRDKRRTFQIVLVQIFLAILDLIGVGIVGILGALTISGASSQGPGNRVSAVLRTLNLESYSIQKQAMFLGLAGAIALLGKTLLSMYTLKRLTVYLSRRSARLSTELISKVFGFSYLRLRAQSVMAWRYQLTYAVDIVSVGILTAAVLMASDAILLFILGIGLFLIEPQIALGTLILFSSSALIVYRMQHNRMLLLGSQNARVNVETDETLHLMIDSYRDLFVRSALGTYVDQMRTLRMQAANLNAERTFMPYVGKFTLEMTTIGGFLLVAGSQFYFNEVGRAVANIAVFFVASARISPAALRIQQGFLMIKGNRGTAEGALKLILEVANSGLEGPVSPKLLTNSFNRKLSPSAVSYRNVEFSYPNNEYFSIQNLDFEILPGSSVGLIGPSGSGKSTIADLSLGIIRPLSGSVLIDGVLPEQLHLDVPGKIAYVPQKVIIANQSLKKNLSIGLGENCFDDADYWWALEQAQLADFVKSLPDGLESLLGVGGIDLSGGQSQRMGLARALMTRPSLLVLDEATSSLDGKTEFLVTEALRNLRGSLTLIVIAHRLSTIKDMDQVLYLKDGKLVAQNTFQNLIQKFPDLAEQADLMRI